MNSTKYIGMDVHKEATTMAVMNAAGKLVMESVVETKAATIVQFIEGAVKIAVKAGGAETKTKTIEGKRK